MLGKLGQHLSRCEYLLARRESERLILTQEVSGAELVQAYRGGALAHYYLGEVFAAIKLGEKALEAAHSLGARELIGRARYDLGEYYLMLGDTHLAHEHLKEFLAELPQYPEVGALEAKAHHNLALVLRQRREYDQAAAEHRRAAQLFEAAGDDRLHMEAIRGIIWCCLTTEQPSEAWPYIQQLSDHLEKHPDDQLRASLLTDLAYYYRLVGDLKLSMDYCEEVLIPGRPGVDDHILATACILAGETAFDLGHGTEAGKLATLGLDYALKAKGPFLMNRVSALRRRILESAIAGAGD